MDDETVLNAGDSGVGTEVLTETADTGAETQVEQTQQQDTGLEETARVETERAEHQEQEEIEVSEFKGQVAAKLSAIIKQAPELGQVFKKYPKLRDTVEAVFRREAALREVFPTVAEARFMREQFPNGQADVQELLNDVNEITEIDKNYETAGPDGTYPGHASLIENFWSRDRKAAVALFKSLPKEWARLDRASYDEVMGRIVGATFAARGIPEYIAELVEAAKEAKQPGLEKSLNTLLNWAQGFSAERPRPTAEQEALNRDRQQFEKQRADADRQTVQQFNASLISETRRAQSDVISQHPAIKRLEKVSAISKEKRAEIIEQIRQSMQKLLANSPSFKSKLSGPYQQRNTQELVKLHRAAFSQPWLLNKMIRTILQKEVPQMVQSNRQAIERRTGTQRTQQQRTTQQNQAPKGPRQIGGRWYKADGSPFTTQEVLSGKHLQQ